MMRGLRDISSYDFPLIVYSQICRRYNNLKVSFEVMEEDMKKYLEVGVDGSGEKSTKRDGRMREVWKVRKGWIKVVIMGVKGKKGKYVIDIQKVKRNGLLERNEKNLQNEIILILCSKQDKDKIMREAEKEKLSLSKFCLKRIIRNLNARADTKK